MTRKYNILMLNYEFPPIGGGAGKANLCLLKEFANDPALSIDVLTSAPKPGTTLEKYSDNITIHKVGVHKKNLHYWRKIEVAEWLIKAFLHYRKLIGQNKYDLVHAFFGFPTAFLCYFTSKKLPYIISLRGSDVPGLHARLVLDYKILGPLFKSIWKKADKLIANSEGLKKRASRFMPSLEYEVIPNGVDLVEFTPAENEVSSDEFKLITVGRLSVTKRVQMLIDTAFILVKQGCKIKFRIVGGGALETEFRKMILQKGLSDSIEMLGRVESEKIPRLYKQSNLFISASQQEGMSNAMLEAMAAGLPIVTTRCEGVDELVDDNGIIVEMPDAESIAKAIKELADDRQRYMQMTVAARKRAEKFSWTEVAREYLERYHAVIGRNDL